MKISAEWFLLDNFFMNYCIFALAAALARSRMRAGRCAISAAFGAIYALLSLSALPFLQWLPLKIALFALFAWPLRSKGQSYWILLVNVFLAAFLMGGMLLLSSMLLGGGLRQDGTVVGTVPLRVALLGGGLCSLLPRVFRKLLAVRQQTAYCASLSVRVGTACLRLNARIDTGNDLLEPISGLPVVLLKKECAGKTWRNESGRPIPFAGMGGTDILQGIRPQLLLFADAYEVDAYLAIAPQPIVGADAIIPASLIPNAWREMQDAQDQKSIRNHLSMVYQKARKALLVYSQRRGAAIAAQRGRGGILCRPARRRRGGKEQTD
jgi:stage II sporulation protein GA (sporulation sigma-E factor processing peptidase)